jgi:LmbE family N-acetylglucosaminyl deacetylase
VEENSCNGRPGAENDEDGLISSRNGSRSMIELRPNKKSPYKVLCVGSHADDIEIGCGGTLLRLIEEHKGKIIAQWLVLSASPERKREAQRSAAAFLRRALKRTVEIENFADSFFPYLGSDIKKRMHQLSREFDPDVIFTHHRQDSHQDHRLIAELTWNAFRDHWILEYEIPKYDGDLGSPNFYVPLSESLCRAKIKHLIDCFKSQTDKSWFTAETFMATHRIRGIECNSKSGYAEAFYCRKAVW